MSLYELCNPEIKDWLRIYPTDLTFNNGDASVQQSPMQIYQKLTINANTSGTFVRNVNLKIVRINNVVTLYWPDIFQGGGLAATLNFPANTIPLGLQGLNTHKICINRNNGNVTAAQFGTASALSDGSIVFGIGIKANGEGNNFDASNPAGNQNGVFSGSISWEI